MAHRTSRAGTKGLVERGTLQHLVFDNRTLASHRAPAAVLGASFLEALIERRA